MLSSLAKTIFGTSNDRLLKKYNKKVSEINALEADISALTDEQLRAKTAEFQAKFANGSTLDDLLVEAFAVVREASVRTLGMRHFDVQLIGSMALHEGKIAEMSTGEGKTLGATPAAYLNALTGHPVYVVTVNDYLAERDANWMRPVYEMLGLTVDIVVPKQDREAKKQAYAANIIYGTNNELGFDYLRDRMVHSAEAYVQSKLYFAIVDEVDSILIDEARTPLIISGPTNDNSELYRSINALIPQLKVQITEGDDGDYTVDEKSKQAFLTESGHQRVESIFVKHGLLPEGRSLYGAEAMILMHHLTAALRAHALFKRDVDYIVSEGQVVIVDEHTGRTMPGRRWSDGLHQAMEAKEGVDIHNENQTLASITFQNFFRLFDKLAGMTGTADTEAFEFQQIYGLEVAVIPTNRPCQRVDMSDMVYLTQAEKFDAIVEDIKQQVAMQRPVLVGTIAIETSEFLSARLKKEGIKHNVLNAKFHQQEASIVAEAGRPGAVTIATNMAGRGTDIVLGGDLNAALDALPEGASEEQIAAVKVEWQARHDQVVEAGGLHILGTERHESRRIDNQLRGRCARQGDAGSSRFYLSLEDSLMRIFASDKMKGLMRKLGVKSGEAIEHPWINKAIANAQRKVEGYHFDIRKQLLQFDNVVNDQRTVIYAQRDDIVASDNVSERIEALQIEVVDMIMDEFMPASLVADMWEVEECELRLQHEFNVSASIAKWLENEPEIDRSDIADRIVELFVKLHAEKETILPLKDVQQIEKSMLLQVFDMHWKEHLAALDYLRQSIHLRGYAQKDPKQEYKREAFALFSQLLDVIKRDTISALCRLVIKTGSPDAESPSMAGTSEDKMQFQHQNGSLLAANEEAQPSASNGDVVPLNEDKIGRNQACPCGSGKKYKHCHGALVN